MSVSTHVLDIARGVPAAGIAITVYMLDTAGRTLVAQATTNADGRTKAPLLVEPAAGEYEIVFAVGAYFAQQNIPAFFDTIPVRFTIEADINRYHVPLLLAPWSYSTYRGS